MHNQQTVIVNNRNGGCLSGCGTAIAAVLIIGAAIQYWYVVVPIVVVGGGAALYLLYVRQPERGAVSPVPAGGFISAAPPPGAGAVSTTGTPACAQCGHLAPGNFCGSCGAAQSRSCSGCSRPGLTSDFCPDCGAATYTPPSP